MTLDHARRLLEGIDVLRNPCDLDLLVFFARHPLTLLANEQLALLLGYESTDIATSLGLLRRAGLLIASENPTYVAQKYIFAAGNPKAKWLPELLQRASTRDGRLVLIRAMIVRSAVESRAVPRVERTTGEPGPRLGPGLAKRAGRPRPASDKRRKGRAR